jgi:hypothetical protein
MPASRQHAKVASSKRTSTSLLAANQRPSAKIIAVGIDDTKKVQDDLI